MAGPITDADVRSAQNGDPAAFRLIYEALAPVVLGYITSRGVADPEATTSDVFMAVLPRLRELRGGAGGLRTFVMSVAHARMVDELRRQARRPAPAFYEADRDERMSDSAEAEALQATSADDLINLLRRLPADQREVVALRFVADLSLEEVAAIIQRSVGAVKQLQRRGLLALRELAEQAGVTHR